MISVHGLSVGYGKRTILHDVDFSAESSQIIALIGPNGCGKTTMLRTLSGQIKPQKGSVSICGQELSSLRQKEPSKCVAFLPQRHEVVHGVSVHELVAMGRAPIIEAAGSLDEGQGEDQMGPLLHEFGRLCVAACGPARRRATTGLDRHGACPGHPDHPSG